VPFAFLTHALILSKSRNQKGFSQAFAQSLRDSESE
jgi:hypothetical protein